MMLVCSLKRNDDSCGASRAFAAAVGAATGAAPPVLEQALTHGEVNGNLGLAGPYTRAVDAFIAERLRG
jgi:hypothetical protein